MAKITVTQVRSIIGRTGVQKRTMEALGFRKMNQTVQHDDNPQIRGMLAQIKHLVKIDHEG